MTADDLASLVRHAQSCRGGLGDRALLIAARRALAGDADAARFCADQLEMMRMTGETPRRIP